jgi:hypothetical protein
VRAHNEWFSTVAEVKEGSSMRKWFTLVVAVAVMGFVGCSGGSEKKTEVKTEKGTFVFNAPKDVTLKQGEEKEITLSIDRKDYKDEVAFDFDKLPDGVSVSKGEKSIEKGQDEVKLMLKAADDAKEIKDQVVKVKPSAAGTKSEVQFKLSVEKKKK